MGEEDFGAPVLHLGEVSKLASIIHCNSLENLREMIAKLFVESVHEPNHRLAGLAGDAERKISLSLFLQQREDYRLLTRFLADHCIALPVADFRAETSDLRAVGNACTITLFVLTHMMLLRFTLECLRKFRWMDAKVSLPDHVVEGTGADHLRRFK